MTDPKKDPSGKKTVKKRIVKKIIKKKKTIDASEASPAVPAIKPQVVEEEKTEEVSSEKPRRRIIKRRAATRRFSKEALEEVLGKKLDKKETEEPVAEIRPAPPVEVSAPPVEVPTPSIEIPVPVEEEKTFTPVKTQEPQRKIRRRRVVKKRPAIKKVIKKKAVTRRLARETVEQVLGKKLSESKIEDDEGGVIEKPDDIEISVTPKKIQPKVEEKKEEEKYPAREVFKPEIKPPEIVIPDDWKEKKISSYKKKPNKSPDIPSFPLVKETLLYEKYEVVDCLHVDCYGAVYKVVNKENQNKPFAIKEVVYVLPQDGPRSMLDEAVQGLKKMVSFIQDIKHINLAKVEDFFYQVEDNYVRFFIVIEYIDGRTLEEELLKYLKENKSISAKSIFKYMTKICDAMSYLHSKKPFPIAFGDLKPSNIMITRDGEIKCINYGMARVSDTLAQYRGTLGYSAPEQSGVDFTNTKADIFAFGVTIYYLLSGINPEDHPYDFKPIKDTKPFISDKVEEFVLKCISIYPEDRPDINEVKKIIRDFDFFELDTSTEAEEDS